MIRLNPVTDVVDSVMRGLVATITPLEQLLGSNEFKEILTTNATTEDCHRPPNHGIGGILIPAKMARLAKSLSQE